jgi:hypothetical protein
MEKLPEFLVWYAVFLFTLTFHEGAHALVALRGGDDTAERGGQVTLNPLPHIRREPFGTIVFPILTFFMSGWMMGWASTPYNRYWADRHPRRVAAMSAAGPVANFVLASIAFVVLRVLLGSGFFEPPQRISFGHMVRSSCRWPSTSTCSWASSTSSRCRRSTAPASRAGSSPVRSARSSIGFRETRRCRSSGCSRRGGSSISSRRRR